jgi:hypothetical protein
VIPVLSPAEAETESARGSGRPARRRWTAAGAGVAAVVAIGAIGTAIAFANERARVAERDRQSASVAAAAIGDGLARATSLLAGVDGLAADGAVTPAEFSAFATDVVRDGTLQSLAWGRPSGSTSPAIPRADAAAVAATGRRAALSRPVKLAPSGRPGFFLIQPIFTAGDGDGPRLMGYVSTGLLAERLLVGAIQRLPPGTGVGLRDGNETVASVDRPGASTNIEVNGRMWLVSVTGSSGANTVLPLALGSSTLLFAGFAGALAYRESRLNRATFRFPLRSRRRRDRTAPRRGSRTGGSTGRAGRSRSATVAGARCGSARASRRCRAGVPDR